MLKSKTMEHIRKKQKLLNLEPENSLSKSYFMNMYKQNCNLIIPAEEELKPEEEINESLQNQSKTKYCELILISTL